MHFLGECGVHRESKQYAQIFVEWTIFIGGRNEGCGGGTGMVQDSQ